MKKGNAVFAFTLKNKGGLTESWHIDLKQKGEVCKGEPEKADGGSCLHSTLLDYTAGSYPERLLCWNLSEVVCLILRLVVTLSLSDDDFGKLVSGKTQAQRLFMSGKLKIKGDVMKVCLLAVVWLFRGCPLICGHRLQRWSRYSRGRKRRPSCKYWNPVLDADPERTALDIPRIYRLGRWAGAREGVYVRHLES